MKKVWFTKEMKYPISLPVVLGFSSTVHRQVRRKAEVGKKRNKYMENIFILPVLFPSHRSFNPLHRPLNTHGTKVTESSWNASWETRTQYVTDLAGGPSQLFVSVWLLQSGPSQMFHCSCRAEMISFFVWQINTLLLSENARPQTNLDNFLKD